MLKTSVCGDPGPLIQQYGHDLYLYPNSNVNTGSSSYLGWAYKHPSYDWGSTQAKEFMAGSYNFKTLDIEIYI